MTKEDHTTMPRVCVIGIGNEFRNDDGIGLFIARALEKLELPGVAVLEHSGEGGGLMDAWTNADTVFLVDAVSSGAAVGTTFVIDARHEQVPARFFNYSTHAFSLAESLELARVLDRLPKQCVVYGIEGSNFSEGTNITPTVLAASEKVIAAILENIRLAPMKTPREEREKKDDFGDPRPLVPHRARRCRSKRLTVPIGDQRI